MPLIKGKKLNYYYLDKPEHIPKLIEIYETQDLIAVDTETYVLSDLYKKCSALDPHTSACRLLQVNYPGNSKPHVIDCQKIGLENVQPFVDRIFADPKKRKLAFNFVFDLKIIKKNFGIWLENAWCVQIMMQLIGAATGYKWHQSMGYSYKALCRDYLGVFLAKDQGSSDWGNPDLTPTQLEYAALDVGAPRNNEHTSLLIAGYQMFLELLTLPMPYGYDMATTLEIEMGAMAEVARMEYTGLPVNPEFIKAFIPAVQAELGKQEIVVAKILGLPVTSEIDITAVVPTVNYKLNKKTQTLLRSPTKLIEYIANACNYWSESIESLDAKGIELIINTLKVERVNNSHNPKIQTQIDADLNLFSEVLELKKVQKMLDKDWLHMINPVTGCIHAGYRTIGTSTGRMSSSGKLFGVKFNAQQIPRKSIVIDIEETDLYQCKSIIK